MAITIDYSDGVTPEYVIQIPRTDMTLVSSSPTEVRQLNIDAFRQELNDLMDDEVGMHFPTNHFHTAPLTISGVTLARVVEILDPYVIEFEDGSYNVNIVGGNSNVADVVVKNQVGVNTANSAGLQDPFALQSAAFGDVIAIDVDNGQAGTSFPIGSRAFPVDNIDDALLIGSVRGISTFLLKSNLTLSSADLSVGISFQGDNLGKVLTIQSGADVENCQFELLTIQGTVDGTNSFRQCQILDLAIENGFMLQCGFAGTITLGSSTSTLSVLSCYSLVAGGGPSQTPTLDLGGTQLTPLAIRGWEGGLRIRNGTAQTGGVSIDLASGRVIVDSTITNGTYTIRGVGDVFDDSTGTAVVSDQTVTLDVRRTRKHQTNKLVTDPATGVATLYDDDGTTVLESGQLYEDAAGAQTYRGQGAERREGFS